ncbi:DUF3054 domain-containing protein [Rhodococcus aerolatus]
MTTPDPGSTAVPAPAPAGDEADRPAPPAAPARTVAAALLADAVAVLAFVVIGRTSHQEGSALLGTLAVAWPFWLAGAVGWAAVRGWRRPLLVWPTGVGVLAVTVVLAMGIRVLTGAGAPLSFVVVTTMVLAVFLLGWRAVATRVARRRADHDAVS